MTDLARETLHTFTLLTPNLPNLCPLGTYTVRYLFIGPSKPDLCPMTARHWALIDVTSLKMLSVIFHHGPVGACAHTTSWGEHLTATPEPELFIECSLVLAPGRKFAGSPRAMVV